MCNIEVGLPLSVNWHLLKECNYNCSFCFGSFKEVKARLQKDEVLTVINKLANMGIRKLTFTGGEPLLFPYIGELLVESKALNLTSMIVSNGSLINSEFLQKYYTHLDWIGLSLDSGIEQTQYALGRGFGEHVQMIRNIVTLIKELGIKLKINSVITSLNYQEDMSNLIEELEPDRWKVFQVLKVEGENDDRVDSLLITEEQFMFFVDRHKHLNPIYEPNDLFRGSYVMLDPLGRFFQNSKGFIEYSRSILEVDPLEALAEVGWDREKFLKRGGIYTW